MEVGLLPLGQALVHPFEVGLDEVLHSSRRLDPLASFAVLDLDVASFHHVLASSAMDPLAEVAAEAVRVDTSTTSVVQTAVLAVSVVGVYDQGETSHF